MPNALLVYPKFPPSYWGGNFALEFVGKKSSMPPLGLLTVASMFPREYRLKVVDMNVRPLREADLDWADAVFTSTMIVQRDSLTEVVERCNRKGLPVVAGGPHPTSFYREIPGVDHFVLGEAEEVMPRFLQDLRDGRAAPVYQAEGKPSLERTPLPRYDLVRLEEYGSMALQFSRGCPFDCEFCDITKLFGRRARTKRNDQVLAEFELLYRLGWRGALFLVDDNFIGNKRAALALLPHIARWQQQRGYPFSLFTEASVNLARMEPLMDAMTEAGFGMVFLGIESPNPEALLKTHKKQNTRRGQEDYLLQAVRTIQHKGIEVTAGFIAGLDGDREEIFESLFQFIREAGIPTAMVGLLTALKGTNLYQRLQREGRLLEESDGNNVNLQLNFVTELDRETLLTGYKQLLRRLYDPSLHNYFERCLTLFEHCNYPGRRWGEIGKTEVTALVRSLRRQIFSRQGPAYLSFLFQVFRRHRRMLPEAFRLAIMGYHYEKITSQQIAVHELKEYLETELEAFKEKVSSMARKRGSEMRELRTSVQELLTRVRERCEQIDEDFRDSVNDSLDSFHESLQACLEQVGGAISARV